MSDCNTKQCTICKGYYPATIEFFDPEKRSKDGVNSRCRSCRKRINRERYHNNPEHKAKILKSNKRSRLKDPELTRKRKRDEYIKHKDKYKASARKNYLKNRPKYLERARNQKEDPRKKLIGVHKRLARKKNLPDTFTKSEWEFCLEYFNNRCVVCGKGFSENIKAYMDHWIPLDNPECPGTVAENMICLCGGKGGCNESKSNIQAERWLRDFYPENKVQEILNRVGEYFKKVKHG